MRISFAGPCVLRAFLLSLLLAVFSGVAPAQSPAIEPCPSTPSAPKLDLSSSPNPTKTAVKVKETVVDSNLADDPAIEKILSPYTAKVRALNVVIGSVDGELRTGGIGANTMGNFVADAILATAAANTQKPIVLAFTNASGLRKSSISSGEVRAADVFELLPFENSLLQIDVTGAQLTDLLRRITNGRDAQSGARVQFRWNDQNRPELLSAKLLDKMGREYEIQPQSTYSIVTIDYLVKLASGKYSVLQEGKNVTPLNLTIRDAVIDYVKARSAEGRKIQARLDDRFVQVGPSPVRTEDPPHD